MMLKSFLHEIKLFLTALVMKLAPPCNYMVFAGTGSMRELCGHISHSGVKKVLVVTDELLVELGVVQPVIDEIARLGLDVAVFSGVTPDPTYAVVEAGANVARSERCDVVLAVGGGSSIDAAKVIAGSATSFEDPSTWVGFGKLENDPLPLFAIPTTSGTGSEATMGAVISDTDTHFKAIIGDIRILPQASALDPDLLLGMPPGVTAATGLDALTHAVEAYISRWDRGTTMKVSKAAVNLIFANLATACENGNDVQARHAMAVAAYNAGMAINQVNVGNVHALAHQLGAKYGVPHGVANALVMPPVLERYGEKAHQHLAELARGIGMGTKGEADAELAAAFIRSIVDLKSRVGLPAVCAELREEDIGTLAERAAEEGDNYPSPVFFSPDDFAAILRELLPADSAGVSAAG